MLSCIRSRPSGASAACTGRKDKEGTLDRQNLFPAIIAFLHVCCFFIVNIVLLLALCLELITWPFARKFAGPYWKHVIFIPFILFACGLPVIICGEAFHIDVSGLGSICFPIAALAILYFCGEKFPREGKLPSWEHYFLIVLPYPAWLFLLTCAWMVIHGEIFHRNF